MLRTLKTLTLASDGEARTMEIGERLGRLIDSPLNIYLTGALGAGKTRFVQGIARGLDVADASVNSPTFTLLVPHSGRRDLIHVDAYRLNDLEEAEQLGLDDFVEEGAVLAIEWAERVAAVLPPSDLTVEIDIDGQSDRSLAFVAKSIAGSAILQQLASDA